jgi:hypothetical protein
VLLTRKILLAALYKWENTGSESTVKMMKILIKIKEEFRLRKTSSILWGQ